MTQETQVVRKVSKGFIIQQIRIESRSNPFPLADSDTSKNLSLKLLKWPEHSREWINIIFRGRMRMRNGLVPMIK